jgi:hypothetical protein
LQWGFSPGGTLFVSEGHTFISTEEIVPHQTSFFAPSLERKKTEGKLK